LAIQTAQAAPAPLAATVELVRARPEHRIYIAGIGVSTNHRLPIFHFLPYRTGICWIGKARLLRLFSTLQNANWPKNKKLASDDSQQDGGFSLLFGGGGNRRLAANRR